MDCQDLDDDAKILKYKGIAMQQVKQRVKLIVEPTSEQALATMIADSEIGKLRGHQNRKVVAIYDVKLCGETITAPHIRCPTFQKAHAEKCIAAFMGSRGFRDELMEGDCVVIFDAGKHGRSAFSESHKLGTCPLCKLEESCRK